MGEEIEQSFNSNRNYEVFWGETKEKRAFEDRQASTQAASWLTAHHHDRMRLHPGNT